MAEVSSSSAPTLLRKSWCSRGPATIPGMSKYLIPVGKFELFCHSFDWPASQVRYSHVTTRSSYALYLRPVLRESVPLSLTLLFHESNLAIISSQSSLTYLNTLNILRMASLRVRRVPTLATRLATPIQRTTPSRAYSSLRWSGVTPARKSTSSYQPFLQCTATPHLRLFSKSAVRYEETIVKVPQMAESISEGTLSSFSKKVGDSVELDEEIASIETDKIDVAVNATAAGVITELLVSEGDTVTVGQDLCKIDAGAEGGGVKEAQTQAKSPATDAQETSSQPQGQKESEAPKKEEKKPEPAKEEQKRGEQPAPPPKKESKPEPPKQEQPKKEAKQEEKSDPEKAAGGPPSGSQSPFGKGSRGENRVSKVYTLVGHG